MKSTQDARAGRPVFNRIAVLRAERGLSRQQLAAAIDVSYQTVGYMERGEFNPSLELVFRVCEFFDLPFEAIFSRTPFSPMSQDLYARQVGPIRNAPGERTTSVDSPTEEKWTTR